MSDFPAPRKDQPTKASTWRNHVSDPRRQRGTQMRMRIYREIREFFRAENFLETETPSLVISPGMETHIRPWELNTAYHDGNPYPMRVFLHTSPEFAMKKLLAGGLEKIFQLGKVFRFEPKSTTHHPEFTMLEWYRAHSDYEAIQRDVENLLEKMAIEIFGKPEIQFNGKTISLRTPWPRLRVRDLFLKHAGIDLVACAERERLAAECARLGHPPRDFETWDDLYFKIWLNVIEPKLPADQAVFVTRYPASQAALARVESDPDGSLWARRFEVYAGGLELGNAFDELTDPIEQRERFRADMQLREKIYGPAFPTNPVDEQFLAALHEGLPPSGGIAMGVDRIIMLFADESNLDYTVWLAPLET